MDPEPEITTMGEKGQVVIPKTLRDRMDVPPRTRFMVFGRGDLIVLKKLALPDVNKEWERLFAEVDRRGLLVPEDAVEEEVESVRRERRSKKKR